MPSSVIAPSEALSLVRKGDVGMENAFSVIKAAAATVSETPASDEAQELVLRLLERRPKLGAYGTLVDALARELGLFPYLDPTTLSTQDLLAYEFHRPEGLEDRDVVFHRPQARVYRELLAGRSVVLSAPTSFGKSLIVDAIIASGRYINILVVVPSIALIDETRRRLSRYSGKYKIITHLAQKPEGQNVYVLTQERVLEHPDLGIIDFFVIDEFYKLSPNRDDDDRAALLNQVFYTLVKRGKPFYMLGPSVTGLGSELRQRLDFRFIVEPYHTVVSELHEVPGVGDDLVRLIELCRQLSGPTIIYCQSPARAARVAEALIAGEVAWQSDVLDGAVEWMSREYHPNWHVTRAIAGGIGVHHGRIPRALAQYVVREFNRGTLQFLVCTSTLIEGVNTKAENIVILDNRINRSQFDYFTFNNIRGRSGRMFEHFIGHVYLFHEPPAEELPFVEVPAFSQSEDAPDSLLVQLEDADLTPQSVERIRHLRESLALSMATIRANVGVSPDAQVEVAEALGSDPKRWHAALYWIGLPTWEQLRSTCELIWLYFNGRALGGGSVRSAVQLATLINQLRGAPTVREQIESSLRFYGADADQAVPAVLDFNRLWANFHFPRLLRALDRIQREVFQRMQLPAGDYTVFAARVESLFVDPSFLALEEYGVPISTSRLMGAAFKTDGDVDLALERLRTLDVQLAPVSEFEKSLLLDAQRHV